MHILVIIILTDCHIRSFRYGGQPDQGADSHQCTYFVVAAMNTE